MEKKPKILFVHGGQGCGKSTVTNALRELRTHTTLFRLAGVPSTQAQASEKSYRYHYQMMEAMKLSAGTGMSFVCDRSFLCEKIYANLGFKAYDFEAESVKLREQMASLTESYEVYVILLTATESTLEKRLNRKDKPQFESVKFEAVNSLAQQQAYQAEFEKLPKGLHQIILPTDGLRAPQTAKKIIELIQ